MRSITSSVRSLATDLVCPRCSRRFAGADARELTCVCGGPLFQEYATKKWSEPDAGALRDEAFGTWRYKRFLPVRDSRHIVTLGEGGTPLVNLDRSAEELGLGGLQVKDEGQNPTGTFKVRGASVAISRLLELGYRSIAMPTVGSGGSAWAP